MSIEHWWKGPVKAPADFENLAAVLRGEAPARPTLFEFFLNARLHEWLAGGKAAAEALQAQPYGGHLLVARAYRNAGYDYVTLHGSDFAFPTGEYTRGRTIDISQGAMIRDRATFEQYPWPDPGDFDYGRIEAVGRQLPDGMRLVVFSPGGVLENTIQILGFERLCYLLVDDPPLVKDVVDAVGARLVRYYDLCLQAGGAYVGAVIGNDDWGFRSQTMLPPSEMRRFIFPWHREIVALAHAHGKPAILHSCGRLQDVMDDVIDDLRYDAKHSYEDAIQPVEAAYDAYGGRIAILGGLDVDFVIRSEPEAVHRRAEAMLVKTGCRGYALGTGNSVPDYVPDEHYLAMIAAVTATR